MNLSLPNGLPSGLGSRHSPPHGDSPLGGSFGNLVMRLPYARSIGSILHMNKEVAAFHRLLSEAAYVSNLVYNLSGFRV